MARTASSGGDDEATPAGNDDEVIKSGTEAPEAATAATESPPPEAPAESAAPQDADEFVSIRDLAKQHGFDPNTWTDDETAAQDIVKGYLQFRQSQDLIAAGQRYAPYQTQFETWLQQQAQSHREPPALEKRAWYKPPEFNANWANLVEFDQTTGMLKARQGQQVSPEVLSKTAEYIQWRKDVQEKLASDPEAAIGEMVDSRARQIAEEIVQQNMGNYQERVQAESFVRGNASWLYRTTAEGAPVVDPVTRQPVLSDEGMAFGRYIQQAGAMGITDLYTAQNYATNMVQRDLLMRQYETGQQQQQAATGNTAIKQNLLNAGRRANHSGSAAGINNPNAPPQNASAPLAAQIMAAMKEAGITDADVQQAY